MPIEQTMERARKDRREGKAPAMQAGELKKAKAKKNVNRWSGEVTRHSNALDLENNVFTLKDPHRIALSLKRSAEHSNRRKTAPYQSAMSMLNFYINRAGHGLSAKQQNVLAHAKDELRKVFHRTDT